ncbi:HWE histidine kinase domain-containing protein [Ensifer adhaerens]|uniref:HWE histidine kinase domain-containing protein n=1 Tax=Ensifer adhaerens TaxID=106592 RepID=UPI003F84FCDF
MIVGASKLAHDISSRKDAERLQSVLVGELNLRAKNFLRLSLRSRAKRMATTQIDPADVRSFEARLSSMARAHDLRTHETWQQGELRAIVEQSISPYSPDRFAVTGPSIQLPPRAVVSMCLALHELATNGAKYDTLAVDQGRVSIAWTVKLEPVLSRDWSSQKTGAPLAPPAQRFWILAD